MTTRLHILLIEDDEVDREAVKRLLRDRYRISEASSAHEGLERYRDEQPDCVLLDYRLPDADGLEVLQELADQHAAVVMLTGQGSEDIAIQAIRQGAQFYLDKGELTRSFVERAILAAVSVSTLTRDLVAKEAQLVVRTEEAEQRARQLRDLAHALTQAEQTVRRRLAESVHNNLQQLLTAARMTLHRASRQADDETRTLVDQAGGLLDEAIADTRALSVELSPPILRHGDLGSALQWLARWIHEKHGLRVDVMVEHDLDPVADEGKFFIFEAVRELLFNVVKHSGVQEASLTLRRVDGERLSVEVSDHGPGCDLVELERRRRGGTGFGLFSILERVEVFGGELHLRTAPGQGFCAELVLPARRSAATAGAMDEIPDDLRAEDAVSTTRILLADDHRMVREGLVSVLEDEPDFEVVGEADDGEEAVRLAHEHQPDVVVMDVNMPRLNGIEATERIVRELPHVRVIGLSVNADDSTAHAMRAAGAIAYLRKDGPLEELYRSIREIHRQPA